MMRIHKYAHMYVYICMHACQDARAAAMRKWRAKDKKQKELAEIMKESQKVLASQDLYHSYICTYIYVYIHIYIYIYIHENIGIHTYMLSIYTYSMFMSLRVHMYIYMFIYIYMSYIVFCSSLWLTCIYIYI